MAFYTFLFILLTYFKSSIKLSIYGDFAILEIFLISLLNIAISYLHFTFKHDVKEVRYTESGQKCTEEFETVLNDDEVEIPDAFRKEYNFLRENAKSLTTLFENYIQRRVSHDTLIRQFQASQENTFLQMRSRVRSDLDVRITDSPRVLQKKKSKLNVDDEHCEDSELDLTDENVFAGLHIFGSGDTHKKNVGINNPPVS